MSRVIPWLLQQALVRGTEPRWFVSGFVYLSSNFLSQPSFNPDPLGIGTPVGSTEGH